MHPVQLNASSELNLQLESITFEMNLIFEYKLPIQSEFCLATLLIHTDTTNT